MFKAIFIANVKEYIRDRSALFWFIIFPLIFVFIFGWVFSGTSEPVFNIGVIVNSEDQLGNRLVDELKSISSFNISLEKGSGEGELSALESGKRSIVIEIPDLSNINIIGNKEVEIPIYYDNGEQQINQVLLSVFEQIFYEFERGITGSPRIFSLKTQSIHSEVLTDFDFILPGILAMALMQLGLFGSIQFLSLKEKKIIRGLGVTPISRISILSSEVLLRVILALIQTVIILLTASLVFDITIVSNVFYVFAVVIIGSITFISLGYMLISLVKTTEGGQGLLQVVQFPMMFLSGVFFPAEIMPDFIQPVVKILPLTYLADALRIVITGVTTPNTLITNILILAGWFLVTLLITVRLWSWD